MPSPVRRSLFALALLPFLPAAVATAGTATIPAPPPPTFADTESSTNFPLRAWKAADGELSLSLQASLTPSNNVELAFGADADGDGLLSYGETVFIAGWDCGSWFLDSPAADFRQDIPSAEAGAPRVLSLRIRPRPRQVAFAAEADGAPLDFGLGPAAPAWLDPRPLNLVKATARGLGPRQVSAHLQFVQDGTMLLVR